MKFIDSNIKKIFLILNILLLSTAWANETKVKPFIKGSFEQIQQEYENQPYIVTFWSESCAFCMKELALFGKLLKKYPKVEIISITTDPFLEDNTINQILTSKDLMNAKKWVFADDYVERLYFDVDQRWRGELPLTYFYDRNNNMLKQLGVINENELIQWLAEQNQPTI